MIAVIDREGCIGCGLCPSICPEVFHMADDGKAEVTEELSDVTLACAKDAAESCPVSVITVEEN